MTVKADKVDEYLKLAEETDTAVMNSEPGMLHHTFDVDPDTRNSFVWSEVYSRSCTKILGACWPDRTAHPTAAAPRGRNEKADRKEIPYSQTWPWYS